MFSAAVRFSRPPLKTRSREPAVLPGAQARRSSPRNKIGSLGVDLQKRQPRIVPPTFWIRSARHIVPLGECMQEFIAGETLHGLSQRHDISRQLIRIWVGKFEAGALDEDVQAADLIQEYEAKIAALERLVGRQALEIELLKGALKHAPRPKSASTSVVSGPAASRSAGDAS